jgi:hypothetical protein
MPTPELRATNETVARLDELFEGEQPPSTQLPNQDLPVLSEKYQAVNCRVQRLTTISRWLGTQMPVTVDEETKINHALCGTITAIIEAVLATPSSSIIQDDLRRVEESLPRGA